MRAFLDSNVVLSAFSESERRPMAMLLMDRDYEISVQVLNEVVNVSRKKLKKTWDAIDASLDFIRMTTAAIHPITNDTHLLGVKFARRYQLSIYDGMIVAAASLADCDVVFSEDMQDGLIINGALTIRNPFAAS